MSFGVKATYQYFAGYEPLSNVTHHSMIDLDLKDIMTDSVQTAEKISTIAPPLPLVLGTPVNTPPTTCHSHR